MNRAWLALATLAGAVVVTAVVLVTMAFLGQRATSHALRDEVVALRADVEAILSAFEVQSLERAEATAAEIAAFEEGSKRHRAQTRRDLDTVIASLREILRQLGGDPSRVPPREDNERSRRRDPGSEPQPSPSPGPSPSPTCLVVVCLPPI